MIRPYYHDEAAGITIYCGDCRDVLPTLDVASVDAVVTDPPYGMRNNTNSKRFTGGNRALRPVEGRDDWPVVHGDDGPFDPAPWLAFPRVILWGANHYAARLPVGTTLVWLKKDVHLFGTFLSDAEIGWMKGGHGVYCFYKQFPPPVRMAETARCVHPNQKPEALLAWCIARAKVPDGGLILDPFMGSGTTLRAAKDAGYRAIGVELEECFCDVAVRRLQQGVFNFEEAPTP